MAKDKKTSKAHSAPKPVISSKPIDTVKAGRVTKPIESAKSAAKDLAKKVEKKSKKDKKVKKAPTPSPEPEVKVGANTSDSSASSDEDSESEVEKVVAKPQTNGKVNGKVNGKTNGVAKPAETSDDSASDSDDSESDDEAPKTNGATTTTSDSDASDDDSDSSADEVAAPKVNGKAVTAPVDSADSDDSDSDASSDADEVVKAGATTEDSDDSEDSTSDSDEEEDEKPKAEEPSKKRKADDSLSQTPKKSKMMVNVDGENKEATANLFVGGLSFNIDEEWLTREFEDYGEIKSVRVITDRETGRSKGFGYVEFKEVADGASALEGKNGAYIDGRAIRVDFSQPRAERDNATPQQRSTERAARYGDAPKEPSATLFVGNLAFGADQDTVTEAFQEYGTVNGVRLITDKDTGDFKGFGYVEMGSIEEATAAFESMQGSSVAGRPVRLDYASARPDNGGRGGGGDRGFGGRGGGRGFGGGDRGRGGRGGRGGDRGRGGRGRGDSRGRGSFNRGGFGDFSGKKTTF